MSRLLIIDDNEEIREELKDRVASLGHGYEEAATQEQALAQLKETAFDCVLLDLQIPLRFEGIPRIEHGKNLLQRIVAMNDAPPVIVITGHGLQGHKLAVEIIELGAATFVGKPFEEDPIEPKIERVLAKRLKTPALSTPPAPEQAGGRALIVRENSIEISGVHVAGSRAEAHIRKILLVLREKTPNGTYKKFSAKAIAEAIGPNVSAQTITNAIKDFRVQCIQKLACGPSDIICTLPGGGYRFAEGIDVRIGAANGPVTQIDQDQESVLSEIRKHGARTLRQLSENTALARPRLKSALSRLKDKKEILLTGSGQTATYTINPKGMSSVDSPPGA